MKHLLVITAVAILSGCTAEKAEPSISNWFNNIRTQEIDGKEVLCVETSKGLSCNWEAYNKAEEE